MCTCERRRLTLLMEAGHDLVASIKNANWGTIRHPTLHMDTAIAAWEEQIVKLEEDLCLSRRKKQGA